MPWHTVCWNSQQQQNKLFGQSWFHLATLVGVLQQLSRPPSKNYNIKVLVCPGGGGGGGADGPSTFVARHDVIGSYRDREEGGRREGGKEGSSHHASSSVSVDIGRRQTANLKLEVDSGKTMKTGRINESIVDKRHWNENRINNKSGIINSNPTPSPMPPQFLELDPSSFSYSVVQRRLFQLRRRCY
jgi:hypothetical protein